MKTYVLSFLLGFSVIGQSEIPPISQTINQSASRLAVLCEELSLHQELCRKTKGLYTQEEAKDIGQYILHKDYTYLPKPTLAQLGDMAYYLGYKEGQKIITIAILTDRWHMQNHRYFLTYPPHPLLYERNDQSIIGIMIHRYHSSGQSFPPPDNDLELLIEDNGTDGIGNMHPLQTTWFPCIRDCILYDHEKEGMISVTSTSPAQRRTAYNRAYANLLQSIEQKIQHSLDKVTSKL